MTIAVPSHLGFQMPCFLQQRKCYLNPPSLKRVDESYSPIRKADSHMSSSIRLSGVMNYALVASILAANPAKLERLVWDNVQQPARNTSLFLQAHQRQPYQQRNVAPWNNRARVPFNGNANLYFTEGPMQNLLGSLAGRCTNLQYLELHKTAERGLAYWNQHSEWPDDHRFKDQDLYVEWARFLASHKGTLRHFVWEHGPHDFQHVPLPPVQQGVGSRLKPQSDMQFETHIWPVIIHGVGDWPCLESIEIRGQKTWGTEWIGEDEQEEIETALWNKFGEECEILVTGDSHVLEHIGVRCRA